MSVCFLLIHSRFNCLLLSRPPLLASPSPLPPVRRRRLGGIEGAEGAAPQDRLGLVDRETEGRREDEAHGVRLGGATQGWGGEEG